MMENYLEYLEKLQNKMDFSESIDDEKVTLYFDMKNVSHRVSNLFILVLMTIVAIVIVMMNLLTNELITQVLRNSI